MRLPRFFALSLLIVACTPQTASEPIRPEPARSIASAPTAAPPPPPTTAAPASASSEVTPPAHRVITDPAQARRLARAIAADLLLYHDEAVQKIRAGGDVPESLASEIKEGRDLYRARVSLENHALYDPIIDELVLGKSKPKTSP